MIGHCKHNLKVDSCLQFDMPRLTLVPAGVPSISVYVRECERAYVSASL